MTDFNLGKGVYVWQPEAIEGGDPEGITARFKLAGVETVAIKVCDGFRVLGGFDALVPVLRGQGIRVGAWGYSYLSRAPIQEAHAIVAACHRYNPDFYLINAEAEAEGNFGGARMFMSELRPALAGLPLGLNSFWNVNLHPTFPWGPFMDEVDFVCPLVYWRGVDPVGKLITAQQSYEDVPNAPELPMPVVGGDMYLSKGVKPTPEQVTEFLNAADSDPFIHGVLMWAADDTQTTPDLWQAFSGYQWRQGGREIPSQPLAWAKVKAEGGMWIRSAPGGAKVGALAKAELTPIWSVTQTKWGAVSQDGNRWIFLGNPTFVESTLDPAVPPPAPNIPALYQARVVPSRGLNVRDAIGGRVLRALPVDTIVRVYEEGRGWARVNPSKSEWVSAQYLHKISTPA